MLQVSRLREAFADALNKVFAAFSKDASGLPIARLSLPREMAGCIKENLRIPGWSFPSLMEKPPQLFGCGGFWGWGRTILGVKCNFLSYLLLRAASIHNVLKFNNIVS